MILLVSLDYQSEKKVDPMMRRSGPIVHTFKNDSNFLMPPCNRSSWELVALTVEHNEIRHSVSRWAQLWLSVSMKTTLTSLLMMRASLVHRGAQRAHTRPEDACESCSWGFGENSFFVRYEVQIYLEKTMMPNKCLSCLSTLNYFKMISNVLKPIF